MISPQSSWKPNPQNNYLSCSVMPPAATKRKRRWQDPRKLIAAPAMRAAQQMLRKTNSMSKTPLMPQRVFFFFKQKTAYEIGQ